MKKVAVVAMLVFFVANPVFAAPRCQDAISGSSIVAYLSGNTAPAQRDIANTAKQMISSSSRCSDERVFLNNARPPKMCIEEVTARPCRTAEERRTCGTVTIVLPPYKDFPGKTLAPVSKCDPRLPAAIDAGIVQGNLSPIERLAANLKAAPPRDPSVNITTIDGGAKGIITTTLADQIGKTGPDADILKGAPDASAEINRLIQAGKTDEAVRRAEQLGLSKDTLDRIRRMQPEVPAPTTTIIPPATLPPFQQSDTTGFSPFGMSGLGNMGFIGRIFSTLQGFFGGGGSGGGGGSSSGSSPPPQPSFIPLQPPTPPPTPPSLAGAEASIRVQQSVVSRGDPLLVFWSSVGMRTTEPCRLYLRAGGNTSQVARANEGSHIMFTKKEDALGAWNFTLQCTTLMGVSVERHASTTVQ